jgi:hypothetical protein
MEDVAKRKSWAQGWLDYIRRNITKTLPAVDPVVASGTRGGSKFTTAQEIAQDEQLKFFLDEYHKDLSNLEPKAIVTAAEVQSGDFDKDPDGIEIGIHEMSPLIQFPMFDGQNMISPIQGVPGMLLGADFDQPKNISMQLMTNMLKRENIKLEQWHPQSLMYLINRLILIQLKRLIKTM